MKWGAGRVDDGGWDEVDVAGVDEDFPAGVMHMPMVRFAEQYAVFYTGFTIVDPVSTMMRLAHSGWPITARKNTSAVSGDQGSADG